MLLVLGIADLRRAVDRAGAQVLDPGPRVVDDLAPSTVTFLLYSFRRCPYAMRARMAIAAAGLDPEHREVALQHRPTHLREISPKATVPVLQLDDGTVIAESLDVMRWALAQNDPDGWLPGPEAEADTESLIATNDGPFKTDLDRFKYAERYEDSDPIAARDRAEQVVAHLDSRLRRHRFLTRESISFADVAIFPFVRQFARTDAAWFEGTAHAAVRDWLAAWDVHPLCVAVMAKVAPWRLTDPPTRFTTVFGLPRSNPG